MWLILQNILIYSVTILIGLISLFLIYYKYAFNHWKNKNVPFLEPSFPLGNMSGNFSKYIGQQIAEIYHDMRKKGHTYCGYFLFASPVFMPLSLELNKIFLITEYKSFSSRGFYCDEKYDPMGTNLATLSGEKWRKWRERLTPMFTAQKTKIMLPIVQKWTKELADVVDTYAKNENPLQIQDLIKRYTVSVICSSAFGVDSNCVKEVDSEFFKHAGSIFTTNIKDNLRLAIGMSAPTINQIFKIQLFNPVASEFFRRVVKESIKYREDNNIDRPDFLNLMIRFKHDLSSEDGAQVKFQNNDAEIITDDEIAAQCFVFFLGGFETTASALSFALYELAVHQEVQNTLRKEIADVLGSNPEKITYELVAKMTYLEMVFKETVRKYPTVHMLNRVVSEDFTIPGTSTVIEKGTKAMLSTMGLHRDPEYYPNPDLFDPERFSDENCEKIPPFAYLPFGDGPRICPGMRFGLMEFKICLVNLIEKFRFTIHGDMTKTAKVCSMGNILGTEEPILLKVEAICNTNNNNINNNNIKM